MTTSVWTLQDLRAKVDGPLEALVQAYGETRNSKSDHSFVEEGITVKVGGKLAGRITLIAAPTRNKIVVSFTPQTAYFGESSYPLWRNDIFPHVLAVELGSSSVDPNIAGRLSRHYKSYGSDNTIASEEAEGFSEQLLEVLYNVIVKASTVLKSPEVQRLIAEDGKSKDALSTAVRAEVASYSPQKRQ